MYADILRWWLVVQALGLLALPLTHLLFRALPDRGYAFSKSLGLLLTGYGAWLLAMLGLGSFSAPLLAVVAALMGGAGLLLRRKRADSDLRFSLPWTRVLAYEALFLLTLLFVVWMRSYNPVPWGTERPMDFAFFNAIQHSATFPPNDPWLAGYSINYYYFGYLLMAAVALLSGVSGAAGYNLSLALIFALTALSVAGMIVNLIALARARSEPRTPGLAGMLSVLGARFAVLLGVVFVLYAGNQAGALQVIIGDHRVVALDGPQLGAAVTQALGGAQQIVLPYPVRTAENDFGTFYLMERSDQSADFNWWWPSRALWDEYRAPDQTSERRYTITEFPFFSFWLGDMHPHVMALPFGLLAAALALATLARPTAPTFAMQRNGWLELILSGVVLGSLYTINSWDLPSYVLLYLGALTLLYLRLADGQFTALLWRHMAQQAALLILAAFLLFAPFHLTFRSFAGGGAAQINLPIIGSLSRIIAPYTAGHSGLHAFLIIFGLFVVPLLAFTYLAAQNDSRRMETAPLGIIARPSSSALRLPSLALPWLPPLLLVIGLLLGFPLLALLGLGLFAARQAVRLYDAPALSFALLVIALGCAICFGTELIYIRDVFGNRMNTIFKFYYQIWLLWGTLAAFGLWWVLNRTAGGGRKSEAEATDPPLPVSRSPRAGLRALAVFVSLGLTALLLAGGLVYPVLVLRDMVRNGTQVGLDGRTPRETSVAGAESIAWLRRNAAPGSVVLEMIGPGGGSYNGEGYAGVSAATGLPTVLGWIGHQQQWRGGDKDALAELSPRTTDVELIYSTLDANQARELLKKYNVAYVYVGALERSNYAPESLAKFAQLGRPVFQMDEVTIYKLSP